MKITDEHIKRVAVDRGFELKKWEPLGNIDLQQIVYEFARDMIELAQTPEPLKFVRGDFGNFVADTQYGEYCVYPPQNNNECYTLITAQQVESEFSSEQYAVEIANDIHKALVKKMLGGE